MKCRVRSKSARIGQKIRDAFVEYAAARQATTSHSLASPPHTDETHTAKRDYAHLSWASFGGRESSKKKNEKQV